MLEPHYTNEGKVTPASCVSTALAMPLNKSIGYRHHIALCAVSSVAAWAAGTKFPPWAIALQRRRNSFPGLSYDHIGPCSLEGNLPLPFVLQYRAELPNYVRTGVLYCTMRSMYHAFDSVGRDLDISEFFFCPLAGFARGWEYCSNRASVN